jgi:hypothetical protein
VELQFGLVYDKYRLRCYYYECAVLLEKCLLTMLLVLLQSQPAALQVLVAMAVIFIETVVHVSESAHQSARQTNSSLHASAY